MVAYYNEFDPFAAAWLRELIRDGLIAPGDVDERSIEDVSPTDLKPYTQAHFFAGIGGWSLALRMAGWPDDRPAWTGSCPCFVANTLVLTDRGQIPIENIVVGDLVLTHTGQFRKVLSTGTDRKETVIVKGQGLHWIETTTNHPFYARKLKTDNKRRSATYGKVIMSDPEWVKAGDLDSTFRWATVASVPSMAIPDFNVPIRGVSRIGSTGKFKARIEHNGKVFHLGTFSSQSEAFNARLEAEKNFVNSRHSPAIPRNINSLEFARFIGYWVGDGWTTNRSKNPGKVIVCGGHNDEAFLKDLVESCGLYGSVSTERTGSRLKIHSRILADWLDSNFGWGASTKSLPTWLHGCSEDFRKAFLDGLLMADGHSCRQKRGGGLTRRLTTASKALAVGVRILVNQSGLSGSIGWKKGRTGCVIEGRSVNEKGHFAVTEYATARSFVVSGIHGWGTVRSVTSTGTIKPVFNIEVEHDNSYIADGIVVHNCQPYSTAGKRNGFADERHLWPAFLWHIQQCRPPVVFGEQVASREAMGWWDLVATDLENQDYACAAANLCAAGVGAPHVRQRLFWVAHAQSLGLDRNHDREGRAGTPQAGRARAKVERFGRMGDVNGERQQKQRLAKPAPKEFTRSELAGFWDGAVLVQCHDGKTRSTKSGIFPLAHGVPNRVGTLRGAGNAIVPQVAAEFIQASWGVINA